MTATAADDFRLGHRPALDGFRGAAVLMVLVGHIGIPQFARAGTVGVTLFFVLSGFLITRILVEERSKTGTVNFRNFYIRRALRLFPAMAVFLAVVGVYAVAANLNAPIKYPALYVANLAQAAGHDLGVLGHTWSLSLEEQFYLVWPALLAIVRTRRAAVTVALAGMIMSFGATAVLVVVGATGQGWERVNFGPDTRSSALFVGCLLALGAGRLVEHRLLSVLGPAALVCIGAIALLTKDKSAIFYLVALPAASLLAAVAILYLLDGRSLCARLASTAPLVGMGRISYGLYLWHFPVFTVLRPHLMAVPFSVRAGALVAASLAISAASYFLVEQPFLRMKDRLASPCRPASPEGAGSARSSGA